MNEQITAIQHFLTHGELRLIRDHDIYLIVHMFDDGRAQVYRNPSSESRYTQITLTSKELANLASLCFPPKEQV